MDFVKREDQNLMDEENYKLYLENLQKSHQMETEYQHTPISMEQLHQAMQSSINSTIVHNFQLPLSPRQMSTLMLKTNLTRSFNEIPAHLPRNLTADLDLAQNLSHDLTTTIRHEDLVLSRNLDLSLARNLSNDLESSSLVLQNINDQDLTRISNDLSRMVEVIPQLQRQELPHNLTHELNLSHHLNRHNMEQDVLPDNRRVPMVIHLPDNQILEQNLTQNLSQRIDQRLLNAGLNLHENQRHIEQSDMLHMPFHIKSEQEDEGYFYDNINGIGNVNGINGHIPLHSDHTQPTTNLHQDQQMYVYNNHNINIPALNPIDLYTRPQYVQNFQNRDNPQNLVVHRQYDNISPYQEEFKKYRQDGGQSNGKDSKEEPKENQKPTDQNKIFYSEFNNQNVYSSSDKNDTDSAENKLIISEDLSLIKGEYVCYKCKDVFPSKRGLKQHAKACTGNGESNEGNEKLGKFTCTQCSYRCQSPAILKIHERTHTGERPFSCTFCDYKSGQKNNVAKHILVHMKEKPFRCQYCEYRCAQKNNLVVHERTHTGYKPFACPYCDYRTVQKPNLVKHMYLHTDQKPFSCDVCSYRCVQKTNLTKHKQRHLNEKTGEKVDVKCQSRPYRPRQKSVKCPHCSYRCVQKSSLEKHLQFKHPEMEMEFVEGSFDALAREQKCDDYSVKTETPAFVEVPRNVQEEDEKCDGSFSNVLEEEERCDETINLCVKKDFVECQPKEPLEQS